MRIVTYGGAVSLDGFLAGAHGEIDWLHYSKDVQQVMTEYWKDVDAILMGRKTYAIAAAMNPGKVKSISGGKAVIRTYVFSRTVAKIDQPDTELVSGDAGAFVRELKEKPGKKICLMGGGELATSLLAEGLVDEIGLNIQPILLGAGVPVFRDAGRRVKLKMTECRALEGGCVLAKYYIAPS
jgi:dihydrofolate reductase